jgi:8-oxo-dGTP pyrophosphatase MutT (NUDIX family)
MDHLDEQQYEKRARAGLIPYMRDESGELVFLMMVSSNSKFGGPRPMLSKGKIESGETAYECAIREAEEELGLVSSNMIGTPELLAEERVALRSGAYHLTVYGVEIRDRWNFGKWCDETEYTEWHSLASFQEKGRKDHIKYVELLADRLRRTA